MTGGLPAISDTTSETIEFAPPGPGSWMLDTTHHGRRPTTRAQRAIAERAFTTGMATMLERYGLPLVGFRLAWVNGCMYVRPMAVGEPEKAKGDPPRIAMWLLARLHPELRRRNTTAGKAWAERRWRHDVDEWFGAVRPRVVARNRELQDVDLTTLDDDGLLEHLCAVADHCLDVATGGFERHGGDIIPVGDYLAHCEGWGIDVDRAATALAGASPASREVAEVLAPVAAALSEVGTPPTSVDELRALGPEVSGAIEAWLADHGWRLLFSDDLDSPTLAERADLQLRALLGARATPIDRTADDGVRAQVPASERSRFDEVLAEARYGLGLRDDAVGVTWNWPFGLLRRVLLHLGDRLVARGRLEAREHALELDPDEWGPLFVNGTGPSRDEVAARWDRRFAVEAAGPPDTLGPPSGTPPFELFPAPIRRAARAVTTMIGAMEGAPDRASLSGTGVGSTPHRGRARIVDDPAAAFAIVEPGDVLVTAITGPSWNSLLPLVGALVVEEGGALSHAAIVARELGIPAVVGVTGATGSIPEGATIEVDPAAGTVRLV